jgi:integrase
MSSAMVLRLREPLAPHAEKIAGSADGQSVRYLPSTWRSIALRWPRRQNTKLLRGSRVGFTCPNRTAFATWSLSVENGCAVAPGGTVASQPGANVKVLQTLLGHKTATLTLDRYGHLFPDDLGRIADAFDAAAENAADGLRTGPGLRAVQSDGDGL